jgi:hypothetical protein
MIRTPNPFNVSASFMAVASEKLKLPRQEDGDSDGDNEGRMDTNIAAKGESCAAVGEELGTSGNPGTQVSEALLTKM